MDTSVTSPSETSTRLLELQEGLKQIKLRHGDRVHLRKTHAASSGPFPVYVSINTDEDHPECEQFDQLEGLKVAVTVSETVLKVSALHLSDFIQLSVVAPQLPLCVTQKMQQTLSGMLVEDQAVEPHAVASAVNMISSLSARLPHLLPDLLTVLPEATEQYETVGSNGNTQRRIKFVDTKEDEVSALASDEDSGVDAAEQCAEHSSAHAVALPLSHNMRTMKSIPDGVPNGIWQVVQDSVSRFPDLRLAPGIVDALTTSALPFTVSVLPSDPNWEHDSLPMSGKVALMGDQHSASNVAAGPAHATAAADHVLTVKNRSAASFATRQARRNANSRQPVLAPKAQGRGLAVVLKLDPCEMTDAATCAIVNQMMMKQAQVHAGKADALRLMLKYAETHLAGLVFRAWDTLLADRPGVVMEVYTAAQQGLSDIQFNVFDETSSQSSRSCSDVGSEAGCGHNDASSAADVMMQNEAGSDYQQRDHVTGLGEAGLQRLGHNSILVTLEGLKLSGTSCIEALKLSFQVACLRCTQATEIVFSASDISGAALKTCPTLVSSNMCAKCRQDMTVTMAPHLVHNLSNSLAHLRVTGCSPADLLPCCFGAQCDGCGALAAVRSVQPGKASSRECQKCSRQISVTFASAAFQLIAAPVRSIKSSQGAEELTRKSISQRRNAKRDALAAALEKLQIGQPLPLMGACKHYRHSHRWLRFPCCGLRFPCDLCHEELTDGHDMAWAKRMVCGYCSLEQPTDAKCSGCGKRLAATGAQPEARKTRFWEGGKGCRDKRLLDPKDKHKYKNSNAKTVSKRAQARKSCMQP
eukprot:jgi/Ulvmu1/4357/UM002_0082.1